jgi:hypothetical protein
MKPCPPAAVAVVLGLVLLACGSSRTDLSPDPDSGPATCGPDKAACSDELASCDYSTAACPDGTRYKDKACTCQKSAWSCGPVEYFADPCHDHQLDSGASDASDAAPE